MVGAMAVQVTFGADELVRYAQSLGAAIDQVPYSMALALNTATENVRTYLIQKTWPAGVNVRNPSFISASLTTRASRATKYDLQSEIYDRLNRGNLQLHAMGGVRTPKGGGTLAIPTRQLMAQKGPHGVPKRLRPRNLPSDRSFRKGDRIYMRDKKGKRVEVLYVLKSSTRVPKRVRFYEDFARQMTHELINALPAAVERAMATRRAK